MICHVNQKRGKGFMRGAIKELLFKDGRKPYGFIVGNDGNRYYFNQESIMGKD